MITGQNVNVNNPDNIKVKMQLTDYGTWQIVQNCPQILVWGMKKYCQILLKQKNRSFSIFLMFYIYKNNKNM